MATHINCSRCGQTTGTRLCWFTEGFDTADLKAATALLSELR
jgi:hypothetical protein